MTDYNRGDVVLVWYQPSADGQPQLRPALAVSSETYRQGRGQVVLAAITSNQRPPETGDTVIQAWQEAGLLGPSMVTGVLFTTTPDSLGRRPGKLSPQDMQAVDSNLRLSMGL